MHNEHSHVVEPVCRRIDDDVSITKTYALAVRQGGPTVPPSRRSSRAPSPVSGREAPTETVRHIGKRPGNADHAATTSIIVPQGPPIRVTSEVESGDELDITVASIFTKAKDAAGNVSCCRCMYSLIRSLTYYIDSTSARTRRIDKIDIAPPYRQICQLDLNGFCNQTTSPQASGWFEVA